MIAIGKTYGGLVGAVLLCLVINLQTGNQLSVSFTNVFFLTISIFFFQTFSEKKLTSINPIYVVLLGAIPLFAFRSNDLFTSLLSVTVLLFWMVLIKLNLDRKFFFMGIVFIFLADLYISGIISPVLHVNSEKLITSASSIHQAVLQHQQDAVYLPFKLRPILFNNSVFAYFSLTQIANFLTLQTFIDTLLIANLYPLFLGLVSSLKSFQRKDLPIYSGFLTAFLVVGINRSPDIFGSLFVIAPFFVYFILKGFERTNLAIYIALFCFSIITLGLTI